MKSEDIGNALTSLSSRLNEELYVMSQEELEQRWYWEWDDSRSVEWNTYQFTDMLHLYSSSCRRWEEHHNGSCCVLERVRDTYKMPKIRMFLQTLAEKTSDTH